MKLERIRLGSKLKVQLRDQLVNHLRVKIWEQLQLGNLGMNQFGNQLRDVGDPLYAHLDQKVKR
jgi:hypothetical protein